MLAQFGQQPQSGGFYDPNNPQGPNYNQFNNQQISNQPPDTSDYKPDTSKPKKEPFKWKNNPKVATLLSMAVPGAGQIYNKKYWKAPLVWALLGATGMYAYISNAQYQDYRRAFYLMLGYRIEELSNNPFVNQRPEKYDFNPASRDEYYAERNRQYSDLQDNRYPLGFGNALPKIDTTIGFYMYQGNPDSARYASRFAYLRDDALRQRDLAGILFTFCYILNMMDAAVDAHFATYKVSEDISIRLRPDFMTPNGQYYLGLQLQFTVLAPNSRRRYFY